MVNEEVTCRWVYDFDTDSAQSIVGLVNSTVVDGGTLGYANPMSAFEATAFIDNLRRRVAANDSHVLIGHIGAHPAFLAILSLNGMTNCRHRAELSKGVVHPDYRGRNLVKVAFRELVRCAERLGVEQFVLDVRENSRAHLLWQRLGFESFGILDDYARVHGVKYRGHFMVQTVASLRKRLWRNTLDLVRENDHVYSENKN